VGGAPASYDADTTVNYELGFKGNAFDKRLALDIDAFYIKWRKIQLSGLSSISTVYIFNGGEARSQGFETTLTYRPIRQLSLTGNLAYIDAVLDGDLPSASSTFGRDGDRLPDTPKWAGLLSADYHFALSADWTGSFGADYRYVSDRPGELAATRYTMPAYHTIDLRAGLQRGRYSINLFANNISNERAYLSTFLMSSVRRVTVNTPRTIGLMLSAQL
jgi:outer membrane receptor protein involved in Fe transport